MHHKLMDLPLSKPTPHAGQVISIHHAQVIWIELSDFGRLPVLQTGHGVFEIGYIL